MKSFIYLRALKHVDYTVFCVEDGQKSYFDAQFNRQVPYSSGQQVKRSILTCLTEGFGTTPAPVTFVLSSKNLGEGEAFSSCDPSYIDLLFGGWMKAEKAINEKSDNGTKADKKNKEKILKRRSPLSISAMRALHPLLATKLTECITYDRSAYPEVNVVCIKDSNGNVLSKEDALKMLDSKNQNPFKKYIQNNSRASGLFVYDIAIDLRTLFCVSLNTFEPEISADTAEKLQTAGWIESKNVFGKCLVMPKKEREKLIPALANALLNWRITSNQSRTFSLMETLAVAISDNANTLSAAIRAKLTDDGERPKAKPIVDEKAGADLFVTLPCAGYVVTESESADAMRKAEDKLIELMLAFDYEHQI